MAEENQVQQEPQQVTTKNLKKVEAGKRLAVHNRRKREEKKREEVQKKREEVQKGGVSQYYSIRAVLALAVTGGLGYYIYRTKKGEVSIVPNHHQPPNKPSPQSFKFEMD